MSSTRICEGHVYDSVWSEEPHDGGLSEKAKELGISHYTKWEKFGGGPEDDYVEYRELDGQWIVMICCDGTTILKRREDPLAGKPLGVLDNMLGDKALTEQLAAVYSPGHLPATQRELGLMAVIRELVREKPALDSLTCMRSVVDELGKAGVCKSQITFFGNLIEWPGGIDFDRSVKIKSLTVEIELER